MQIFVRTLDDRTLTLNVQPNDTIDEIKEIVEFLKHPKKYIEFGCKLPRGYLLVGSPGVGKTLIAKAISGEADVPLFTMNGSEFDEIFVGVGAKRVKKLFQTARDLNKPCIIFIDEFDSLASKRNGKDPSYTKQTVNQLLSELDGFKPQDQIIVIAATNFEGSLDPAVTRSGRFDKRIHVPLPDIKGRTDILNLYLSKLKHDKSLDINLMAKKNFWFYRC